MAAWRTYLDCLLRNCHSYRLIDLAMNRSFCLFDYFLACPVYCSIHLIADRSIVGHPASDHFDQSVFGCPVAHPIVVHPAASHPIADHSVVDRSGPDHSVNYYFVYFAHHSGRYLATVFILFLISILLLFFHQFFNQFDALFGMLIFAIYLKNLLVESERFLILLIHKIGISTIKQCLLFEFTGCM